MKGILGDAFTIYLEKTLINAVKYRYTPLSMCNALEIRRRSTCKGKTSKQEEDSNAVKEALENRFSTSKIEVLYLCQQVYRYPMLILYSCIDSEMISDQERTVLGY